MHGGGGKFISPLKCFVGARIHRAWLRTTIIVPLGLAKNAMVPSSPMLSVNVLLETKERDWEVYTSCFQLPRAISLTVPKIQTKDLLNFICYCVSNV